MKQLTLVDTQNLVAKLTKSLGERGAARHLNKMGYRSPEGHEIRQGHISRVQAGSWTCFLGPEEPPKAVESGPAPSPIAARPPVAEAYPEECIEMNPSSSSLVVKESSHDIRQQLRDELEAEEAARQEKEMNLPPFVPNPSDHSRAEHSNVQRFAHPHAIFSRRGPIEIKTDEEGNEETFFGIPKLQHRPPTSTTRPYQPKSYGENVVSTR